MLTVGEEEFRQATALAQTGQKTQAIAAFEKLQKEYHGSWIDRAAGERLKRLRAAEKKN